MSELGSEGRSRRPDGAGERISTSAMLRCFDRWGKDCHVWIDPDGALRRLEDVLRDHETLVLLKGSFDPIHVGHIQLLEAALRKYPESRAAFGVSVETEKRSLSADESSLRVEMIRRAGFPVILSKTGFFFENAAYVRAHSRDVAVIFPLGVDVLLRVLSWYTAEEFRKRLGDAAFEYHGRPGYPSQLPERYRGPAYSNIHFLGDHLTAPISSTQLRGHKNQGRLQEVQRWMPPAAAEIFLEL